MVDLRVYAALCGVLSKQLRSDPPTDRTLDSADGRTAQTTGYRLVELVGDNDGGPSYARLLRSLNRLGGARVDVELVESDPDVALQRVLRRSSPLIGDVWVATERLHLENPRQWGALKGSASLRVEIGRWTAQRLLEGPVTVLDLALLRQLGPGVAGRVWAMLEAWGGWQPAGAGRERMALGLGQPALDSLGVGDYTRRTDARRAVDQAATRIVAVDPAYSELRVMRRAGWQLTAERQSGARKRAGLRRGGDRESDAEHAAVRATARASLAGAAAAPAAAREKAARRKGRLTHAGDLSRFDRFDRFVENRAMDAAQQAVRDGVPGAEQALAELVETRERQAANRAAGRLTHAGDLSRFDRFG